MVSDEEVFHGKPECTHKYVKIFREKLTKYQIKSDFPARHYIILNRSGSALTGSMKTMTESQNPSVIYLSKEGKIFGPYTQEQYLELKTSGELLQYSWIWDGSSPNWMPVIQPPSSPPSAPGKVANTKIKSKAEKLQVICHNRSAVISGLLGKINSKNFVLVDLSSHSTLPPFAKGGKVYLNLLDEVSEHAETAKATITHIQRRENHWELEMSWDGDIPAILS